MSIAQIIGLVVVLLLAIFLGFLIVKKSEKYSLLKWLGLFFLVMLAFTWIFEGGYFAGGTYQVITEEPNGLGFTDLLTIITYGFQSISEKLIFLLAVGAFYGVMSKTDSYKKLVSTIAKKLNGKEILFVIIASLLFVAMGSLLTQSFVALVFVPFIISILLNLKLDKITAFVTTIGSMLVGLMGATYGYEGISEFNYYLNMYGGENIGINVITQLLVVVVAYILLNIFTVLHVKNVLSDKKLNESEVDPFKVEKTNKKTSLIPSIVIMSIIFILVILGYVGWNSAFGITCFDDFHKWLTELAIADFAIFGKIFGSSAAAFGAWTLSIMSIILVLLSLLAMITSRMKFDELLKSYVDGFKVMAVPVLLVALVQSILYISNYSPTIPVMINSMVDGLKSFNPFITSFVALISSVFQPDLGFNALTVAGYFVSNFADSTELIQTIFVTIYGLVQLFVPTSALLLVGLAYLNIDYKSWIKYIWKYVLGLLVILIVLFTVLAYI